MCGGSGAGGLLNTLVPNFQKLGQDALFPAPKAPTLKKPPKPIEPNLKLAADHVREAAIGAYGYSDTVLTGGKGIGSAGSKNLWKSIGGS